MTRTATFDPSAGFEASDDHFSALWEGYRIGSIFRLGGGWVWAIEIMGIGGARQGKSKTFADAETALTVRWHEREATLGIDFIKRAIALAYQTE
jgi:hypothetical protein